MSKDMRFSEIGDLDGATEIYGLKIAGDRLAPEIRDGQWITVQPQAMNPKLAKLAGVIVVAAIKEQTVGVMRTNADGDLVDAEGGYVAAGQWRPLGIATSVMTILVE